MNPQIHEILVHISNPYGAYAGLAMALIIFGGGLLLLRKEGAENLSFIAIVFSLAATFVASLSLYDCDQTVDHATKILQNGGFSVQISTDNTIHVGGTVTPARTITVLNQTVTTVTETDGFSMSIEQAQELSKAMLASTDPSISKSGQALANR